MKVEIDYVWEHIYRAVLSLASGKGGIRERLVHAWFLNLDRLDPGDYPDEAEELADEVRALRLEMNAAQNPQGKREETYRLSVAAMTEGQAVCHAERIVALLNETTRLKAFLKHLEKQAERTRPGPN